jgi:adenylate cyclase
MRRKLAVILASDVAGYSRLVALDEETAIARFARLRLGLEDLAAAYQGRVFNTAGDAILIEFASATDAVRCAIEFQELARGRNRAFPPSQSMLFRIGIALGDVLVQEDGDLLGDGVNLAARLQSIALPGGIVLSHDVHAHVERNLSVKIVDLGQQELKNLTRPVRAYALALPDATPADVTTPRQPLAIEPRVMPAAAATASGHNPLKIGIGVLAALALFGWFYLGQRPKPAPTAPPAQVATQPVQPSTGPTQAVQTPPEPFGPNLPDGWKAPDLAAETRFALVGELQKFALPSALGDLSEIASEYLSEEPYKALAVAHGVGFWRIRRSVTERDAAAAALEACHLTYGKPCMLIARGDVVLDANDELRRAPQVMARLIYSGSYDPAKIPIIGPALRVRADVAGYAAQPGPKAMAMHPLGRIAVATGANVQEAEAKALAQCDALGSPAVEGPCRTYALDNDVVLPQRRSLVR